jgi:CheY-like chemotaxis protein
VPQKLLLADDSVTIQRVIELTFADEDIQVIAVSDGDQAIARLDADPPDIVLADVGMPGRDGYEVAAYVKQSPRLAHIPVVLLTGAFEPVDQARANAVGCDGVLAKPFEPQLVIGRVKELLARPGRPPLSLDADLAPPVAVADTWTPPLADQPLHAPLETARPAESAGDDAYFDRLDAAFANLPGAGGGPSAHPAAPAKPVADATDWFGWKPGAPPVDLPLSYASPQPDFDPSGASGSSRAMSRDERPPAPPPRTEPGQSHAPAVTAPPGSAPPRESARPTLPPLADAFAALLAAEQATPASPAAPAWPAPPAAVPAVTDDLIEQITRRVLERLSDRVVRETVSDIVSAVAERLVREEIERIKSAIK